MYIHGVYFIIQLVSSFKSSLSLKIVVTKDVKDAAGPQAIQPSPTLISQATPTSGKGSGELRIQAVQLAG